MPLTPMRKEEDISIAFGSVISHTVGDVLLSVYFRYPAFRSQSLNVSKHVAVLSELARLVDVYHLLDVSQFEQELACANDHTAHYRELMEKLSSPRYRCIALILRQYRGWGCGLGLAIGDTM